MSNTAITVENLSKSYLVGHSNANRERYTTLRDVIGRNVKTLTRKTRDMLKGHSIVQGDEIEEFWALKEVNFEIKQGDRVGIIGRNGAGKSTLLKILSRITEPSSGRIAIHGRVASLLEVGTGFHPELTGRENIFLNGAISGMSRKEVKRKFDEIVDFSEVEKFLDTPVKHYSSGMYVRLAFAVAASLDSEILILDEVLAVGDSQFQKKCLSKMDEVSSNGRTVLFVSHNMAMISNLCTTALVLKAGKIDFSGPVSQAVSRYYQSLNTGELEKNREFISENAELLGTEIVGLRGYGEATINDELTIKMRYLLKGECTGPCVPNFHFFTGDGSYAFVSNAPGLQKMSPGIYVAECTIPSNLLNEGMYFVGVGLTTYPDNGTYQIEFYDKNALSFNIIDPMDDILSRYNYVGPIPGLLRPKLSWQVKKANS